MPEKRNRELAFLIFIHDSKVDGSKEEGNTENVPGLLLNIPILSRYIRRYYKGVWATLAPAPVAQLARRRQATPRLLSITTYARASVPSQR